MGDEKEADCYPNPCYSTETVSHGFNKRAVGDAHDQHLYEPMPTKSPSVKPQVHSTVETGNVNKPPRNVNKSLVVILICIATASAVVACVALGVSIWSAFTAIGIVDELSSDIQMLNTDITMESVRVNNLISSQASSIQTVSNNVQTLTDFLSLGPKSQCGSGNWRRVAFINMSLSSYQCPSTWREYPSPVRSCGRPVTSSGSCSSALFKTYGFTYTRVCGRANGYQYGTTDAFRNFRRPEPMSLDDNYVDGVSVTHGNPRTHIWTFAAGYSANHNSAACHCDNSNADPSPSFIGNSYFCQSSVTNGTSSKGTFYDNNTLWDGNGCGSGSSCCTFNSPPWFTVELPSSTRDDIEVRICADQEANNEDTPIELLEIYVQYYNSA